VPLDSSDAGVDRPVAFVSSISALLLSIRDFLFSDVSFAASGFV